MTSHHSQPMPTPDLAALLSRRAPNRATPSQPEDRAVHHRPPEPAQPDTGSATGDDTVSPPSADTPPSPRERVYLQSITVYLPRTTAQRLTDAAAAAGMTRTAFILQAVNATHTDIAHSTQAAQVGVGDGDLFAVPQAHRSGKAPSVQTTIRVTDDQLAGLTRLAAQAGTNRSRAITACLELYLSPGEASTR